MGSLTKKSLNFIWLFYIVYVTSMDDDRIRAGKIDQCERVLSLKFEHAEPVENLAFALQHLREDNFIGDQRLPDILMGYYMDLLLKALPTIRAYDDQCLVNEEENPTDAQEVPLIPTGRYAIWSPINFCLFGPPVDRLDCRNIFIYIKVSVDMTSSQAFDYFYRNYSFSNLTVDNIYTSVYHREILFHEDNANNHLRYYEYIEKVDILKQYLIYLSEKIKTLDYQGTLPTKRQFCEALF